MTSARNKLEIVKPDFGAEQQTPSKALTIKATDLKQFTPLSEHQREFFELYDRGANFVALHGSAGTGKTFIAFYKAIQEVLSKSSTYTKLIIVRSAVPSREIGYLPGDVDEKLQAYTQPYHQICATLFGRRDAYQRLEEQHKVEFMSTSYLRGTSFDNAIIIVDEDSNLTFSEINTTMTRVGYRSKIIWCGDYAQTDLSTGASHNATGYNQFMKVATAMQSFDLVEFNTDDIVRSALVKEWITTCERVHVSTL